MLPLPFADHDEDDHVDENNETTTTTTEPNSRSGRADSGEFFAPSLCRQLSFEGLMGGFLKNAAPKKGLRKKQEDEVAQQAQARAVPERGSLGRSLSVEDLGVDQEPHKPRRGRRPERQGEATETAGDMTQEEV